MTRTQLLLCLGVPLLLATFTAPAHAQAASARPTGVDAMRASFAEVADWIVRAAESVPEAQYNYRPKDTVRTLGQLVGHVADGNNYYCGRAAGKDTPWAETVALSGAGKAALVAKLKESIAACDAAHNAANAARSNELLSNYGHASLHYGNLITYLRMLSITPPSS